MERSVELLIRCEHIEQLFLIPLTIWTLIGNAFLAAQFT